MDRTADAKGMDERVVCPRIAGPRTVEDHLECRYCWGAAAAVRDGDRRRFCDSEAGRDPLCFGFPEQITRLTGG